MIVVKVVAVLRGMGSIASYSTKSFISKVKCRDALESSIHTASVSLRADKVKQVYSEATTEELCLSSAAVESLVSLLNTRALVLYLPPKPDRPATNVGDATTISLLDHPRLTSSLPSGVRAFLRERGSTVCSQERSSLLRVSIVGLTPICAERSLA